MENSRKNRYAKLVVNLSKTSFAILLTSFAILLTPFILLRDAFYWMKAIVIAVILLMLVFVVLFVLAFTVFRRTKAKCIISFIIIASAQVVSLINVIVLCGLGGIAVFPFVALLFILNIPFFVLGLINFIKYGKCDEEKICEIEIAREGGPVLDKYDSNIETLKKFKELLDMGAITQEEYDAKKKELLNL